MRYVCSVGGGRGVWVAWAAVLMVWDSRLWMLTRDGGWEVDDAAVVTRDGGWVVAVGRDNWEGLQQERLEGWKG